ncbi:MAG: hypothetical protein IH789_12035, partial [Acidobacteria bacterium]|nr:hypothetical protein [Acidobacteriota bacterium]
MRRPQQAILFVPQAALFLFLFQAAGSDFFLDLPFDEPVEFILGDLGLRTTHGVVIGPKVPFPNAPQVDERQQRKDAKESGCRKPGPEIEKHGHKRERKEERGAACIRPESAHTFSL